MRTAVVLRSDTMRETLFNYAETDKLPEQAYTATVTAQVYAALGERAARVLRAGHSAIVDAVFAKTEERGNVAAFQSDIFGVNQIARSQRRGRDDPLSTSPASPG